MAKVEVETEALKEAAPVSVGLDQAERRRLIGAVIWFAVLIIWVPSWYEHPVNFQPEKQTATKATAAINTKTQPIADKVYRLPKPSVQHATKRSSQQSVEGAQSSDHAFPKPKKPVVQSQTSNVTIQSTDRTIGKQTSTQSAVQSKQVKVTEKPATAAKAKAESGDQLIAEDLMLAKGWFVRLAAFKKMATANELLGALQAAGYDGYVKPIQNNRFFVVVIGVYPSKEAALKVKQRVDARYHVKSQVFHR